MNVIITTILIEKKVNAVLDIGNSKIKIGIFQNGEMTEYFSPKNRGEAMDKLNEISFDELIISSVQKDDPWFEKSAAHGLVLNLDGSVKLPITIDYETPETLGADRIAAAVGALKDSLRKIVL